MLFTWFTLKRDQGDPSSNFFEVFWFYYLYFGEGRAGKKVGNPKETNKT